MVNLLNESRANEKKLEAEIAALKKVNTESTKRLEEMSTYLKTQDHINILKLKERDLLLKELTEQINELRSQVKRDQKLLLEVRNGNALPVIESKKPPRRSSENNNKKVIVLRQLFLTDSRFRMPNFTSLISQLMRMRGLPQQQELVPSI